MTKPRLRKILPAAAGLLLALPFVRSAGAPQPAGAPLLDLQGYEVQLNRCASALAGLQRDPAAISAFRLSLPAEWDVRAGNETFRVSAGWLDAALGQIAARPETAAATWPAIQNRLNFLEERSEALASQNTPPPVALARQKLDAIFREREFRGLAGPGPLQLWWMRLTAWIDRGIAWVLARLHLGFLTGNVVAYVLIAIVLIFLSLWGWRSLRERMRQAESAAESEPLAAGKRAWAADALAAAQRGEFREAIRCAYWAAVVRLEELGTFSPNRSRTPREMLNSIAFGSRERGPFRELTHSFELVWYGQRLPSRADWENTKIQMERIGCPDVSNPPTAGS